jgi:hypothetical protein
MLAFSTIISKCLEKKFFITNDHMYMINFFTQTKRTLLGQASKALGET